MRREENALTAEELLVSSHLRAMRLSRMAEAFEKQMLDPNADLSPFMDRFSRIVNEEWDARFNKKFNKLLRQAKLRYPAADLDGTIYDPDRLLDTSAIESLSTCGWIDEGRNLLISGKSSSGKTYLANALSVAALRQFKTVRYIKASRLMSELEQARIKETYMEIVDRFSKYDLLVIDDFGLMILDPDMCRDLFEVIDGRDGRRSTIVISQLPVASWFDLFAESTYADACLTRLTDRRNSYRLEMNGKDMREPS
jgi:DNA replication protein DnaC